MELSWKSYAEWLVSTNGVDIFDALEIIKRCSKNQHREPIDLSDIIEFLDERDRLTRLRPDDIQGPFKCRF